MGRNTDVFITQFMALMLSCLLSYSHYSKNRKPTQGLYCARADFLFFAHCKAGKNIQVRSLERVSYWHEGLIRRDSCEGEPFHRKAILLSKKQYAYAKRCVMIFGKRIALERVALKSKEDSVILPSV